MIKATKKTKKTNRSGRVDRISAPKKQAPKKQATEPQAPEATAPEATAPVKKKRRTDAFKRITVEADVPGVEGKITLTLVEVAFGGMTHRANTRKACSVWLKEQRKKAAEETRIAREADKDQKALERGVRMAPAITERLAGAVARIEKLAANETITDEEREAILDATAQLAVIVTGRKEQDEQSENEEVSV